MMVSNCEAGGMAASDRPGGPSTGGEEGPHALGGGYNHIALTADALPPVLGRLEAALGVTPEKPPFHPGDREDLPLIAFVADPDGYRIELIDGGRFDTPQ